MDDLFRERLGDIAERMGELASRLSKLEQDNQEMRSALLVLLTKMKKMESRHSPKLLKRTVVRYKPR